VVLVHFSSEVDMASDSPARSLDEIDLSALRVSRTCFLISFLEAGSGRVVWGWGWWQQRKNATGREPAFGF
jgi:hypothetical protein